MSTPQRPPRRAALIALLAALLAALLVALLVLALLPATARAQPAEPATLTLELAGQRVAVDVYRPTTADGTPRGAVILSHGFTRSRTTSMGSGKAPNCCTSLAASAMTII